MLVFCLAQRRHTASGTATLQVAQGLITAQVEEKAMRSDECALIQPA